MSDQKTVKHPICEATLQGIFRAGGLKPPADRGGSGAAPVALGEDLAAD